MFLPRERRFSLALATTVALLLTACAVQLAPLYDKEVVDGLNAANADALALFASAAGGTTRETYPERASKYDHVIGEYDALAIQGAARPVPKNDVVEAVKKMMSSRNTTADSGQVIPSTTAIKGLSETLSNMKAVDQKRNISAIEVMAYRGQAVIYMDQALTYEAALER